MRKLAHIINPVVVGSTSDLHYAQPVTFESMRTARRFASNVADVTLFTAQFPEDREMVPEGFSATRDLGRSVLDEGSFRHPRRLPLLADILDRLAEATDAEFLIYTNVDIALLPTFYIAVDWLIDEGFDAFVVNRRTISEQHQRVDELPLMYGQVGQKHPGHDCFIFRHEAYQKYHLGRVCLGAAWVAKTLLMNMAYFGERFQVFTDKHLTFHIGDPRLWTSPAFADYRAHNYREFKALRQALRAEYGALITRLAPGSNIPPLLEERLPWFRSFVKSVTPEPIYRVGKRIYRTINPVREEV